jgi:2-amino-4-hydroxy-6-hydroxymethyldihydropteridine diphosphokinase
VLALGSNLGDRLAHLRAAVASLAAAEDVELLAVSPVYETDPVGGPAQADYLNAVALVATTRTARSLLALAQEVEASRARTRTERWGPRTLDVDVVSFADVRSDDPTLTLPHPRAHERAFVLAPWHDLDPDAVLPGGGRVADLLAATGASGVRRRDDLHLEVPA